MITEPVQDLHPLLSPNQKNGQTLLALIYQELVALRKDLSATKETLTPAIGVALPIPTVAPSDAVPNISSTERGFRGRRGPYSKSNRKR